MLLQGQHDAVGNDGCQDHILEGSGRSQGEEKWDGATSPPKLPHSYPIFPCSSVGMTPAVGAQGIDVSMEVGS